MTELFFFIASIVVVCDILFPIVLMLFDFENDDDDDDRPFRPP